MRVRWFGEPWPSAEVRASICDDDAFRVDVPVGQRCIYCPDLVKPGERGVVMAAYPGMEEAFLIEPHGMMVVCATHIDCLGRATIGPELAAVHYPPRTPAIVDST